MPGRFLAALVVAMFAASAPPLPLRAAQAADPGPEKSRLRVAIAAYGPLYLPLLVAQEAGYFSRRGVKVDLSQPSATASAQALTSGTIDVYQGGAAIIHANVGGDNALIQEVNGTCGATLFPGEVR
ncbi:MAG TPA: ABC transporter substrate-binding protein [candidate division Zixibacteria bacterium]|nr:ABC transporter substrate-binding protein [candidate division Zixibacteria bacterium]